MRKTLLIVALAVVFAAAFTFALVMPVQAAGGGCNLPPGCYYACDCAGTPLVCCSGGCKVDLSGCWNCPQIYNC